MKGDDDCQGIFHQEENHFIRTVGHVGQKIPTDDEKRQILGQSDVDHRPHRCAEEPFVQEYTALFSIQLRPGLLMNRSRWFDLHLQIHAEL